MGDISYHFDRVQGPTVVMVVKPFEPLPAAALHATASPVILSSVRRNHPRALDPAIKSCNLLNNILAVREAQAKGAFEPIMLNDDGRGGGGRELERLPGEGGVLLTPPLDAGILAGVTRGVVLELARGLGHRPCARSPVAVKDLLAADEAFITSTLKEVMPIADHRRAAGGLGPAGSGDAAAAGRDPGVRAAARKRSALSPAETRGIPDSKCHRLPFGRLTAFAIAGMQIVANGALLIRGLTRLSDELAREGATARIADPLRTIWVYGVLGISMCEHPAPAGVRRGIGRGEPLARQAATVIAVYYVVLGPAAFAFSFHSAVQDCSHSLESGGALLGGPGYAG